MVATPLPVFLAQLKASVVAYDPLVARVSAKAGDQIANQAKRNAPRRTGALRTSIKSHPPTFAGKGVTVSVTAGGPSSPHEVDYAQYVELGTSKMAPRPFMRPAVDKVLPQWEKELADVAELLAAGKPGRISGSIRR